MPCETANSKFSLQTCHLCCFIAVRLQSWVDCRLNWRHRNHWSWIGRKRTDRDVGGNVRGGAAKHLVMCATTSWTDLNIPIVPYSTSKLLLLVLLHGRLHFDSVAGAWLRSSPLDVPFGKPWQWQALWLAFKAIAIKLRKCCNKPFRCTSASLMLSCDVLVRSLLYHPMPHMSTGDLHYACRAHHYCHFLPQDLICPWGCWVRRIHSLFGQSWKHIGQYERDGWMDEDRFYWYVLDKFLSAFHWRLEEVSFRGHVLASVFFEPFSILLDSFLVDCTSAEQSTVGASTVGSSLVRTIWSYVREYQDRLRGNHENISNYECCAPRLQTDRTGGRHWLCMSIKSYFVIHLFGL